MTKLKVFWYLSEAVLLAIWIVFFACLTNSIWFGIGMGVLATLLTEFRTKIFDKVKVSK